MPIIQQTSPLDAATSAVAGYFQQKRADQQYQQQYTLQKQAADTQKALAQSQMQTEAQNRKIAAAQEQFEAQMRPLYVMQSKGQISAQQLQNAAQKLQNDLTQRYGAQEAQVGIQQATANLAATQFATARGQTLLGPEVQQIGADTAATQAATQRSQQLLPGEVAGQRLGNIQTAQQIEQMQGLSGAMGGLPPPSTAEEREWSVHHAAWSNQLKAAQKSGQDVSALQAQEPMDPDSFRSQMAQAIGRIATSRNKQKDLHDTIMALRADPRLTPYQKQLGEQRLRQAAAGGSDAASPFPVFPGS